MRIALAVALVATIATVARSQTPDTSVMKQPMDPENPTAFIILHRADLRLADSQVTHLQNIGVQLALRTRPLKDSLDDLRPGGQPQPLPTSPMTPAQRDSFFASRRAAARVMGEMHDAGRSAREQATAVLTPDQQKKLQSIQDQIAFESRMAGKRPSINQNAAPPGTMSGAGTRPY